MLLILPLLFNWYCSLFPASECATRLGFTSVTQTTARNTGSTSINAISPHYKNNVLRKLTILSLLVMGIQYTSILLAMTVLSPTISHSIIERGNSVCTISPFLSVPLAWWLWDLQVDSSLFKREMKRVEGVGTMCNSTPTSSHHRNIAAESWQTSNY